MDNGGTPKNLSEAIRMGIRVGPMPELEHHLSNRLTELLNNRFGAAVLRVGMEWEPDQATATVELLEKLLAEIIGEPQKD